MAPAMLRRMAASSMTASQNAAILSRRTQGRKITKAATTNTP